MSTHDSQTSPSPQGDSPDSSAAPAAGDGRGGVARRGFLGGLGVAAGGMVAASTLGATPAAASERSGGRPDPRPGSAATRKSRARTTFGIGYETWFLPTVNQWASAEAKPVLGYYDSSDTKVISQHAKWLSDAGFDYILIDWSNNLGGNWTNGTGKAIIDATRKLLDVYTKLRKHPKFVLLLGMDSNDVLDTDNFRAQITMLETEFLAKPEYRAMWQELHGKPLLQIYHGFFAPPPPFTNDNFTVRFTSAFREVTMNPWGDWSWLDRTPLVNGPMTLISPFSAKSFNGWTAGGNWSLADAGTLGAYATTKADGDKTTGSLTSPPFKLTERVITYSASGVDNGANPRTDWSKGPTLDRNLFFLLDAKTGEVLRHAEPPSWITENQGRWDGLSPSTPDGIPTFYMQQWNVSDLVGREVVFQAVANSNSGWLAVGDVAQTADEQMTACVAHSSPIGGWPNWGSRARQSGATLVNYMNSVFDYEPETVLLQQWNEFSATDQYSVPLSNDIEPTVVTRLEGADSDGWGSYYLDLAATLIRQYRDGVDRPQVALDFRYP